jgi:predicted nucleic acid-binding protein
MAYLFDSDVIIYYISGVPRARELFARFAPDGIFISTISYMEVLDGIPASPDPIVAGERFNSLIDYIPLIGFEPADAERCVELRHQLRREGKP